MADLPEDFSVSDLIDKTVAKTGSKFSEEEKHMHKDVLKKVFEEGQLPYEAMGFSEHYMEFMYHYAYQMYNSGNYKRAKHIFLLLTSLNPISAKYWLGAAATVHNLNEYERAIMYYITASTFDLESPLPYYHAADCQMKLNKPLEAILFLNGTVNKIGDDPKYSAIKERAIAMIKKLDEDIRKKSAGTS